MKLETARQLSTDLARLLGLRGHMVAIRYLKTPPEIPKVSASVVACQAIQDARFGKTTILTKTNSKCLGASYFLGFEALSPLAYDFWIENEQSLYDGDAAQTMVQSLPGPPLGFGDNVLFEPLSQSSVEPDLVLIVGNPEQIARLLGLHIFKSGEPVMIYSYGATCQSTVGIPITTGRANVSFIDLPSRKIARFEPTEQVLSVPYTDLHDMLASVTQSINGTGNPRFNRKGLPYLSGEWCLPESGQETCDE